ncbi:MAG: amidohydrolase family protein [Propionibacteriales bacterium]|nr:amidohydrolase family protein [Propionibacteriales bacterium]
MPLSKHRRGRHVVITNAIDAVTNFEFEEAIDERPAWLDDFIKGKIGNKDEAVGRFSVEDYVAKMDRAGVERSFLAAVKSGSRMHKIHRRISYEQVADVVQRYPDRFSGLAGVDPTEGMAGLRELEHAVKDLGFIGAHLYPHWFEMAPDHARYYPIYAKCCELDIPIQMQVGHCLRYTDERPLKSVGRPITLDTIACDFPELKIVGIHIGWPWDEEMIAVAYKHPNVYIGSDAYAPRHWSPNFVKFIDSWGSDKVLFGTDYPVIDPERAVQEIEELGIREDSMRKFMRDNALRLYDLADVEAPAVGA